MPEDVVLGAVSKKNFVTLKGNKVEAVMSDERDHRLGALRILGVNGKPVDYIVWGMPKIYYPYQRDKENRIDKEIDLEAVTPDDIDLSPFMEGLIRVVFRDKLDGTNVTWFPLRDSNGNILEIIAKTRRGILNRPSQMHTVFNLLGEIERMYPGIEKAVRKTGYSLSFEVYGFRNPHTITYDFPLRVAFLVAINQQGKLISYDEIKRLAKEYGFRLPKEISFPFSGSIPEVWVKARSWMDKDNIDKKKNEGVVFTFCYPDTVKLVKCKAKSLEEYGMHLMDIKGEQISRENLWKAICRVYDDGFTASSWDEVTLELEAELGEDYESSIVVRHEIRLQKLWDYKLRLESVRWIVEKVVSRLGTREMSMVMPEIRRILGSKEKTNLAAKILLERK